MRTPMNAVFCGCSRLGMIILWLIVLVGVADSRPAAAACTDSPSVSTDKADYGPTETVTISGSGFACGTGLFVLVTAPDGSTLGGNGTGSAGPDAVVTSPDGDFTLGYHLSGDFPDGTPYHGQLGIYRVDVSDSAGSILASVTFSDAIGYSSCALTAVGGVKCWGHNGYGQLGNGATGIGSATPVDVVGLASGVTQITVGYLHACALTNAGGVKCWGNNWYGQLGNSGPSSSSLPMDVPGLTSGVVQVNAGIYSTCAVTAGGGAKCWGYNGSGQLGNGSFVGTSPTPLDVAGLTSGVVQVTVGFEHACAVTASGGAKCWGSNGSGQLGTGSFAPSPTPADVTGLTTGVVEVKAGGHHTCAVTTSGGAKCWGYNNFGGLGNGTFSNVSTVPVDVTGLTSGVAQVSLGFYHTCAVTSGGGAKCWGYNYYGGLGNGIFNNATTPQGSTAPVDVIGLTSGVAQVSAGFYHTCGLTTSGGAQCWGYNYHGQLGNGIFNDTAFPNGSATPVNVTGLTSGVAALWDDGPSITDAVTPTASPTQSPAGNGAGWNNTDVMVTWNWTDTGGSGLDPANCTTSSASSGEGNAIALNATCKDLAGNMGDATYSVMVDKTDPTVNAAATASPNGAGWYNADVTVAFVCSDALSGVVTCPAPQTLSTEGTAVNAAAQDAIDNAGNSASSNVVTVKIDKTQPLAALVGGPSHGGTYYFGAVPAAPTCSASDALSGLAGCTVTGFATVVGSHTVTATATDFAGNVRTASVTYTVLPWTLNGFYQPIDMSGVWNTVKNGATVPIKFEVFAGSFELTDPSVVVQPLTATQALCSGGQTDDIELLATGGTILRYDPTTGQFIYNWQTPKKPGYCYTVTVTLTDGTSLSANIKLK